MKPKKYKLAIIAWLAVYPGITLIFAIFENWLMVLPLALRTLVLTLVLVPYMVYLGVPVLSRWLGR